MIDLMRDYEIALEDEQRLKAELEEKEQELEELNVILQTDYVDLLEQTQAQYDRELKRMREKRDSEVLAQIEHILQKEELTQVADILKLLHKLKKLLNNDGNNNYYSCAYFLKQRQVYLEEQKKYLGEDVKRWTIFLRTHLYTLLFQLWTLFGEEDADGTICESNLVPRLLAEYLRVVRVGCRNLKSSLEYSTLWTLLTLTDRALAQVGVPFLPLVVPIIRDAYVRHLVVLLQKGNDVMAVLNEWRHFRPSFAATAIRLQISRFISNNNNFDLSRVEAAMNKLCE